MLAHHFISRQSLLGLLCAQTATLTLHLERLPIWLILLALVVIIWRVQIYRSQWSFPNRWIRLLLSLFSMAAVVGYYPQWYALEPMVSLLIIAFLLKLLEVDTTRDAVVLVFVGFFVAASSFLFDQGIVITLWGIVVIWLWVACLLVLQAAHTPYFSRRTLRIVSGMLLQAVPLMLLMLFVFPRIGALWSVPLQSDSAVTGVSDSMSPGDFSQLTRSRKLAFRVTFDIGGDVDGDGEGNIEGESKRIPDNSERYWRGLVLTDFDGRQWTRNANADAQRIKRNPNQPDVSSDEAAIEYEVVLEPTNTPWLYAMPVASLTDKPFERSPTNELWLTEPVTQRIKYQVRSVPQARTQETAEQLRQMLLLPRGFNPRTIQTAQQWRREASSDLDYINRVLNFYNQRFTYTLSPPKLGRNTVDEFLFSTQSGFCEHYSSSFVVLMRAAGIPARVVTGYQGGEWNAEDRYLTVRQYDAHAWAEVWLPGEGWVRVDPTAAVAPNRIEQGLLDSLTQEDQDLVDARPLPSFAWLNRMVAQWDSLNYRWQRWVLSYDKQQQSQWLQKLLGEVTPARLAVLLVAPGMLLLLIFGFITLWQRPQPLPKTVKLYQQLVKKLNRGGVEPLAGETISDYCRRAAERLPESQSQLNTIGASLNHYLYAGASELDTQSYQKIRGLIQKL